MNLSFDPITHAEQIAARANLAALRQALPPVCLPGDIKYIFASKTWTASADGFVRVCLCSGGGGGGNSKGGGASALAFWRWRKIKLGEAIVFVIGTGGANGTDIANSASGGTSSASAPWGAMTASPGVGATTSAEGAGGASGSGADYYHTGGNGGGNGGGALNPMDRPVGDVGGSDGNITGPGGRISVAYNGSLAFRQVPALPGWLSVISGSSPSFIYQYINTYSCGINIDSGFEFCFGNGGGCVIYSYSSSSQSSFHIRAGRGGGGNGAANGATGSGGAGFAIVEFCQAVY